MRTSSGSACARNNIPPAAVRIHDRFGTKCRHVSVDWVDSGACGRSSGVVHLLLIYNTESEEDLIFLIGI